MAPPQHSRISRYHGWLTRWAGWVLAVGLMVGAVGATFASRLQLKTSLAELLPSNDPGVVALNRTAARVGGCARPRPDGRP